MLRIDNSSDYLAPSALCIKTPPSNADGNRIKHQMVSEVKVHSKGKPVDEPPPSDNVEISVNDCLACSGCITSSETVLVQSQSTQQFMGLTGDGHVESVWNEWCSMHSPAPDSPAVATRKSFV